MYENRKRYSQNFLRSSALVRKLLMDSELNLHEKEMILEIGPGNGIITHELVGLVSEDTNISSIEIDQSLANKLSERFAQNQNVQVVRSDILKYQLPKCHYTVVSNIPFGITSSVMRRLLDPRGSMDSALLIMQKEAAEMFMGVPGNTMKSLLAYPYWSFKMIDQLKRTDFEPKSGVDSVVMRVDRREIPLISVDGFGKYEDFINNVSKDRVGEGVWKQHFTNRQLHRLEKSSRLVRHRGIASQKPEAILGGYEIFQKREKSY